MNAQETVLAYFDRVYNQGDVDAIAEFCADPCIRHASGSATEMSIAQQIERSTHTVAEGIGPDGTRMSFATALITGDDTNVCMLWNMTAPQDCPFAERDLPFETVDDKIHMCGAEIFRLVDGLITEVWNPPAMAGHWR